MLALLLGVTGSANAAKTCAEREIARYSESPLAYLPPKLRSAEHSDNPMLRKGYLNVRLYGADPSGSRDSTKALQQAFDDATNYRLAVYLPPGAYVVTDTLHFVAKRKSSNCASTIVTGNPKAPAKIILAKTARGFDDPDDPQPVIAMWKVHKNLRFKRNASGAALGWNLANEPQVAQYNIGFMQRIANLEIDTNGHRGAIGIHFRAAQDSHVENVTVHATDSYAGFYGLPSRTSAGAANITVIGGRYGIYLPYGDAGSIIVGATLTDQTESAIFTENFAPVSLVGFSISRSVPGSALTLYPPTERSYAGALVLYDGSIVQRAGAPAIANSGANRLYARNVYIMGTDELVEKERLNTLEASGVDWHRIDEYSYISSTPLSMSALLSITSRADLGDAQHLINGDLHQSEVVSVSENSGPPPQDLQSRHWLQTPFFLDGKVIDITEAPYSANGWDIPGKKKSSRKALDTEALQRAIDDASARGAAVFVPRGFWFVDDTIELRHNTVLFGVGRALSRIITFDRWQPKKHTPVLRTDDRDDAHTYVAHLGVEIDIKPSQRSWFNHLHWRAGRNSAVVGVAAHTIYRAVQETQARANFRLSGSGGGRWYFMGIHAKIGRKNPGYRHLLVEATREPLWWYGLNMEKAESDVMAEIVDAENIRIFGSKNEGNAPNFRIHRSRNVAILGGGKHSSPPNPNSYFIVDGDAERNSEDILIASQTRYDKESGGEGKYALVEIYSPDGSNNPSSRGAIAYGDGIALFKRGEIDDSAMRHGRRAKS